MSTNLRQMRNECELFRLNIALDITIVHIILAVLIALQQECCNFGRVSRKMLKFTQGLN